MQISKQVHTDMTQGSWIRKMFEAGARLKQEFGDSNVFDLSLGNPIMEPPEAFQQKLSELSKNPPPGMHRYMPNAGYKDTREAVANNLSSEIGIDFTSEDIVMCCGAGGGLNVVLKSLLDPGDEVITISPYFVEYGYYVGNHQGRLVVCPSNYNFMPDIEQLAQSISAKTKAILINSPNNPTGVIYPSETMHQLGMLIQAKEAELGISITLISDEPYRKIIYDDLTYPHPFRYHNKTIVVTSHSKDLGLAGERIGYIAMHPLFPENATLLEALIFCNRTLGFVNAPALMQRITKDLQQTTIDVGAYQSKRDLLYAGLIDAGYEVTWPQGAFYMFPKSPLKDDVAFTEKMLNHKVLIVPGSGFGTAGHFRLSYCVEDSVIKGAISQFQKAKVLLNNA